MRIERERERAAVIEACRAVDGCLIKKNFAAISDLRVKEEPKDWNWLTK